LPLNFFSDDDQIARKVIKEYPDNLIFGRSDRWLQWYKDKCYPNSWQRKKLNERRKKYYYNNQKKILKKLRVIYKEKGTD